MILLWGLPEDEPLRVVQQALDARGAAVLFLDQYEVLRSSLTLHVGASVEGLLRVGKRMVRLEDISAAYVRPYDSVGLLSDQASHPAAASFQHAMEFDAGLRAWLEVTSALVVNPLHAMAENNSKPLQAMTIRAAGFEIPDTIVTTDRRSVQQFWDRHGAVIYKSTSGIRSVVSRLTPAHRQRLHDLRWCPTQFQEHVAGTDVRVHVVGEQVFGCEVLSDADDYRYAGRQGHSVEMRPYDLPPECAQRCLNVVHGMGLAIAGVDLRRTPEGRWYCFEVNPSPGFTYFQSHTGQPIGQAVADLLLNPTCAAPVRL